MARPAMDKRFIVTPEKYISVSANSTEIGIEQATMNVGRISRKNSSKIRIASAAPSSRFSTTELIARSI